MDLRRVVSLHFVQPFSCCEDRNEDFHTLHMSDQKPEAPSLIWVNKLHEITDSRQFFVPQNGNFIVSTKLKQMKKMKYSEIARLEIQSALL